MFLKLGLLSKFECLLWPAKSFIAQPATIVLQNFANITVFFLQNRRTNVRRVAQFRDNHRVSGKIVEPVMLWLQTLARNIALVAKTANVYLASWLSVLLHHVDSIVMEDRQQCTKSFCCMIFKQHCCFDSCFEIVVIILQWKSNTLNQKIKWKLPKL